MDNQINYEKCNKFIEDNPLFYLYDSTFWPLLYNDGTVYYVNLEEPEHKTHYTEKDMEYLRNKAKELCQK